MHKLTGSAAYHRTAASPTCPQPRHPRRRVSVVRVARPQLPVDVVAPAVDTAARPQGARVFESRGKGNDACGKNRIIHNRCIVHSRARTHAHTHAHTHTHTHTPTHTHTHTHTQHGKSKQERFDQAERFSLQESIIKYQSSI